jgi:hypothetical protein
MTTSQKKKKKNLAKRKIIFQYSAKQKNPSLPTYQVQIYGVV